MRFIFLFLLILASSGTAFAVQPNEMLSDTKLEARARSISEGLRCLVCQNQSIDDSDADLAHDLRMLVRQRLQAGDSNAQVNQYLIDRYGDYILLDPPFKLSTWLLWSLPPVFGVIGIGMAWLLYRRRNSAPEESQTVVTNLNTDPIIEKDSKRGHLFLLITYFLFVPVGAGLTYLYLGSPELPAKPYTERKNDPDFILGTEAERMAAALAVKPDASGYARLGDAYSILRHFDRAIDAYQKAISLNPKDANLWSELGEAIGLSQNGLIIPEARAAFSQALRVDPKESRARFYLGLGEVQINQPQHAVAIWRDLEKDSAPDAPWLPMIKKQIASVSKKYSFDAETIKPQPPTLAPPNTAEAIMGMNSTDQNSAIHTMVDRLAARLKDNPNDLEGWERLAKSYQVLGETEKAKNAEQKIKESKSKGSAK